MVATGRDVFYKQYVTYILDPEFQVKDSGIYFTLAKVYDFGKEGYIDFDSSLKHYSPNKLKPFDANYSITLEPGSYYIEFNEKVSIPDNMVGFFFTRKALLYVGGTIEVFPIGPAYTGKVGGLLTVTNSHGITFVKHARVGLCVFVKTDH